MPWQPTATLETLKKRARLLKALRSFFYERDVMEVDVPVLGRTTVADPNIESLAVTLQKKTGYLQTSPEYYMKRLLAAGSGSIFYLGKAFRAEEEGRRHRLEFTMLEWYRVGFDDRKLISEVAELFNFLSPGVEVTVVSYGELFETHLGINPYFAAAEDLAHLARDRLGVNWPGEHINVWLDLLFSHVVEPAMDPNRVTIVTDYPASQCALARMGVGPAGEPVAKRFEVFWKGVELANGYWELVDAGEQRRRFAADNETRKNAGKKTVTADELLLDALEQGLPDCAGVALGVDRLLMCLLGEKDIKDVLPF